MYETEYPMGGGEGVIEALGMAFWIFAIAVYVYMAYTQYVCAKKVGCEDKAFMAFIPIAQTYLLCPMAGKPGWWFVLCLIPFVNIVIFALLWIEIAKRCGHAGVWGFLSILFPISLIAWGVLAFGKGSGGGHVSGGHTGHEQPRHHQPVG